MCTCVFVCLFISQWICIILIYSLFSHALRSAAEGCYGTMKTSSCVKRHLQECLISTTFDHTALKIPQTTMLSLKANSLCFPLHSQNPFQLPNFYAALAKLIWVNVSRCLSSDSYLIWKNSQPCRRHFNYTVTDVMILKALSNPRRS